MTASETSSALAWRTSTLSMYNGRMADRGMLTLRQPMHCCGDSGSEEGTLTVEIHDGGGGAYIALSALEWAIETPDQVKALGDLLLAMLANCDEPD